MSTVVSTFEVEADENSDDGSDREDNYHYDPAVVLIYPVQVSTKHYFIPRTVRHTMICVH
jgi:hypothetical protein